MIYLKRIEMILNVKVSPEYPPTGNGEGPKYPNNLMSTLSENASYYNEAVNICINTFGNKKRINFTSEGNTYTLELSENYIKISIESYQDECNCKKYEAILRKYDNGIKCSLNKTINENPKEINIGPMHFVGMLNSVIAVCNKLKNKNE